MDYEKKYNEALDRAKSFQEKYGGDYAGYIFPELSESEDERIRKEIMHHISLLENNRFMFASKEECLAYLEKQKEQKPAEWSAEDARRITAICELLANTLAIHPNYSHRILIDWLKSLRPRPHWKPSEEQMEALKRASTNEYLPAKQFEILVSLYEQLKQL